MRAAAGMAVSGRGRALSQPVDAFLGALGSGAPAPGGGAAAALCGALAAALVAMVSRVTTERDPSTKDDVGPVTTRADELRHRLGELVDDDVEAYRGVLESRASGPDAVQTALKRAIDAPLHISTKSRDVLALCETLAPLARRSAVSDLGVAAALAWGALESGALTARVNLKGLQDAAVVRAAASDVEQVLAEGQELRHRAGEIITRRMERQD
jgi:methenyltetrahydrofolate cyclohydrolase